MCAEFFSRNCLRMTFLIAHFRCGSGSGPERGCLDPNGLTNRGRGDALAAVEACPAVWRGFGLGRYSSRHCRRHLRCQCANRGNRQCRIRCRTRPVFHARLSQKISADAREYPKQNPGLAHGTSPQGQKRQLLSAMVELGGRLPGAWLALKCTSWLFPAEGDIGQAGRRHSSHPCCPRRASRGPASSRFRDYRPAPQ